METEQNDMAMAGEAEAPKAAAQEQRPEDMEPTERANLARFLTEEEQKKIVQRALDRHTRDIGSREDRMRRLRDIQEHYALVVKKKSRPFENCANIKTPTVTAPVLQISARLFDMTWPATGKIFNVVAGTAADLPASHVTEQFSNSYVRYNIPDAGTSLADTINQKCLYGSAFRRTYWDAYTRKVKWDRISIDDFVVPYAHRSSDPSMADVPHYTYVMHMPYESLVDFADDGLFVNIDKIKRNQRADESPSAFAEATQKVDGVSQSDEDESAERQVIEHHCRWKLPSNGKHPSFDGKSHYVYMVIDAGSQQLLRMCLREEDDPDDVRRFNREMRRYMQYQMELQTYQAAVQSFQVAQQMDVAGPPGMLLPPMPQPPPPPQPVPAPKAIRKRQICFFTHYRCFQGEGFYGIGYGDLLLGIAVAMNTIINQHVDGASLRNAKPAFMSRQVRIPRGSHSVRPGEFIEVDGPITEIQKAIMFLDPPQNDPSTVPLIRMLDSMKDSMVGNADLMSGQVPGSNQTKAGMEILSEQLMMPISVLARETREELRHDLDKMWRCFGVFLEDDEFAEFLNVETGQPQTAQLSRSMFSPTVHLVPASDPRAKSQRVEDHQKLFGYVMNNPYVIQGPAAPAIMRALTEEGFRIFPDGEKLIPLLPPMQPPGPPPPPPPKPQWAENAGFLRGEDSPVNPQDDDDEHTQFLMSFLRSPQGQMLDKVGRDMAERHMRAHQAQSIEKKGAQFEQFKQQSGLVAGLNGGGPTGMAGPPSNAPVFAMGPGGAR